MGNGLCPACRREFSDTPAEFQPVSAEEISSVKVRLHLHQRVPHIYIIFTGPAKKEQRSKPEAESGGKCETEDCQPRHSSCSDKLGLRVWLTPADGGPRPSEKAGLFWKIWKDPPGYYQPWRPHLVFSLTTTGQISS